MLQSVVVAGVSLRLSYKSTWFLMHRLREAMRVGGLVPPMGSDGGAVEYQISAIVTR
jgi:hypothetical protein